MFHYSDPQGDYKYRLILCVVVSVLKKNTNRWRLACEMQKKRNALTISMKLSDQLLN